MWGLHTLLGGAGEVHPAILRRRVHDAALAGAAVLVTVALAMAIAVAVPHPSFTLLIAGVAGGILITWLIASTRYEFTVLVLALYLGLLDGPVKLLTASTFASGLRNVLILAVCFGALIRLLVSKQPIRLPPLSGWVLAFTGLVLMNAFNPNTQGFLKTLGGFRQQLEWVPFFFFGYLLMRSNARLRMFFLVLGVIALANGAIATYQTRLSPPQLASWGPGYRERVEGNEEGKGAGHRTYKGSEGTAHVRPLGLGSDAGFGGGTGVLALPCALALLATGRLRRRWVGALLCLGALVAIATGLGRLQVVGGAIALLAFGFLAATAGRRITRPLLALMALAAIAIPLGAVFVSAEGSGVFSRYTSISPSQVTETSTQYKASTLAAIPTYIKNDPFGFGLGSTGAVSSFGGRTTVTLEGHGFSSETQYNMTTDELGLPGLIIWVGLSLQIILLVLRRLRYIRDVDLRISLAGVFAALIAYSIMGFSGPFLQSAAAGPFFWFAAGIASYWFAGPGFTAQRATPRELARAGDGVAVAA
jgi:hypothetical protein